MEHGHHGSHVRYEKSDANPGPVIRAMLGLAIVTAVTAGILVPFFSLLQRWTASSEPPQNGPSRYEVGRKPPKPWLQEKPFEDIRELRAYEKAMLTQYAWVDQKAGIVRMPIDVAMKVVVARGLPVRATSAASATVPEATLSAEVTR